VLLALIAGLWVANLQTVYESRAAMVLLNVFFTWLASLCICVLTARGFLASGRPGFLMFGCGSLVWGITSLVAAMMLDRVNTTVTVHNLGVFEAALCHFVGLMWRGRLARPGRWLVAGYASALASAALIVWAAAGGLTPVFFVQGQGGTLVRQVVLVLATGMFAWVAGQMVYKFRRQSGAFYYWYGLGLALTAAGLTGVIVLTVQGGILGWTNRLTQYLGGAYLFTAALMVAREGGTWGFSLAAMEGAWRESDLLAGLQQRMPGRWVLRYGLAMAGVAVAMGLRVAMTAWIGPGLPPYVTFYPIIMMAALLGGFGPGLAATMLAAVVADYWVLPPVGHFAIASPVDRLGLLIFVGMGLFMSVVAELYRRNREKAAAYDREAALRESQARLASFAGATFEGIVESEAGRIVDCNEQLARMLGYTVGELRGMEIASLIAPEDLERVSATVREGQDSTLEHGVVGKDGRRIIVEAHGRPMSPGSARRHTALRDITERKRAEEAIQAALDQFYLVLSSMTFAALLVHKDGGVGLANQAFCDLFHLEESPADLKGLTAPEMLEKIKSAYLNPEADLAHIADTVERGLLVQDEEVVMRGGRTFLRDFIPIRLGENNYGRLWIHKDITERKRTEEALRMSEARLRRLMEMDPIPLGVVNKNGEIVFLNESFIRVFGYAQADIPTLKAWWQRAYPDAAYRRRVAETWEAKMLRAAETHAETEPEEFNVTCKDGTVRVVVISNIIIEDSILASFIDITERKQAEQALHKRAEEALRMSEEEFRSLAEAMPQIVWATRPDGWNIYFNQQWVDYTGMTMEESYGHGWNTPFHPEDKQRAWEAWQRAIQNNERYSLECRLRRADGVYRWWLIRGEPMRGAKGEILKWFGTCTDIEEIKQAQSALLEANDQLEKRVAERTAALRERDERFTTLLANLQSGVALVDERGQFVLYNGSFLRIFGLSSEVENVNSVNWSRWQVFGEHAELLPVDDHPVRKAALSGKPVRNQLVCVKRPSDGEALWLLVSAEPILKPGGTLYQMICTYYDITERKRMEERLEASLREKEVMLKEIHHRVKNNLQVIASLVDLQADSLKEPGLRGVFAETRDRVRSMALVHEKLYQSENLARVEFADYARSLLNYLARAHSSSETNIGLKLDLQPVSLPVETAAPCGLILNELVTNAFKHAFRGRAQGEIALALRLGADGRVSLRVSDNGLGLPEGLDWRQSRSLGLRLIHLLAGQLNAAVEVRTGGGTEFLITFEPPQPQPSEERSND
jgi:PAS domain S-box-containing protein